MDNKSAVEFEGASRIHIGLAVKDLEQSVVFYQTLLGEPPTKTRPGYAKFEVSEPRVNLSLNLADEASRAKLPSHFGIQVKTTGEVTAMATRFSDAGMEARLSEAENCCYAEQDKVWVSDPQGNSWEVFVVLDNDVQASADQSEMPCCASDCCSD